MRLTKLDIVDWEPCVLWFIFSQELPPDDQFRDFVEIWLRARRNVSTCMCTYRYAELQKEPAKNAHVIRAEWVCEQCAQALADAVERQFPGLQRVELGLRNEPRDTATDFIQIPDKNVELEDGTRIPVESFLIARRSVTTGEYEAFVRHTGYVTAAEVRRSPETFRSHCGVNGMAPAIRSDVPAQFLTIRDAEAFCRYANCRLPTEAEWLAAAVIDPIERDISPLEEFNLLTGPGSKKTISVKGWDFTSTTAPDGRIVTRRGPVQFLKKGWRDQLFARSNRVLVKPDHFDMSLMFRLVRG